MNIKDKLSEADYREFIKTIIDAGSVVDRKYPGVTDLLAEHTIEIFHSLGMSSEEVIESQTILLERLNREKDSEAE